MLSRSLFLLVTLFSCAVHALDFSPKTVSTDEDGSPRRCIFFVDGDAYAYMSLFANWSAEGSPMECVFSSNTGLAAQGVLSNPSTRIFVGGKIMREEIAPTLVQLLPPKSDKVTVVNQPQKAVETKVPSAGGPTEAEVEYTLANVSMKKGLFLVRTQDKRWLQCIITAPRSEYAVASKELRNMMRSWFPTKNRLPEFSR